MIYRIVKGNSFRLHILVSKLQIGKNKNTIVDYNMNKASNIKVELIGGYCENIELRYKVSEDTNNELICDFPNTIDIGNYAVRVSWKSDGVLLSSCESNMFAIVPFNRQSKIPLGIVDGEPCGMYNLKYYITTDDADDFDAYTFWYGSSSASDVAGIRLDELTSEKTFATGRSFTIATTDVKNRVWFVCTEPVTIMQAGLVTSFNTAQSDGLFYYWSDELVAGNDNIYTIGGN